MSIHIEPISSPIEDPDTHVDAQNVDEVASCSDSSDGVETQDSDSDSSSAMLSQYIDSTFDPAIHLAPMENPIEYIMMTEMGYQPTVYSAVAATKPVPLFTLEAVRRIRAEISDSKTLATHLYSDDNSPCVLRGHCPDKAKFTYNALTHPEVQKRINTMAGIDITHVYNYELGHA